MNEHRYKLEPYDGTKSRYHCPECKEKVKTFSLYIDSQTGEPIHPTVGRCNRESSCGYHYTPKQYFQDNRIPYHYKIGKNWQKLAKPQLNPKFISTIPVNLFKDSLKKYEHNNFVVFLIALFGVEITSKLISRYFIATSKHWPGANVFWQIDIDGKVRTGKIMLYNPNTGKRTKEPFNHIAWVHTALKQPEFKLKQCLFGEHLLIDKTKPVAIVESEKTAIIASVYLPGFIWLACGMLQGLNPEKCNVLEGRTVVLFPDLKGFDKWKNKMNGLSPLANFAISDLLERKATQAERERGDDLADFLIQFDYREFEANLIKTRQPLILPQTNTQFVIKNLIPILNTKNENWEKEISDLQLFFTGIQFPTQSIRLNQCCTITDVQLFIESHFETVKANNGKPTFLPYLNRLQDLKKHLTVNLF